MKLATATKIRIAGAIYTSLTFVRRSCGFRSDTVVCRRGGVTWSLDLRDGVQLSIYLFGTFERTTGRALRRWLPRGGVAIDVGANVGAHTLPMAHHVGDAGRVIAIEPTQTAIEALRRNVGLNPDLAPRITVHA